MKKAGFFVSKVSKTLFEKKGFVDAKIIANWRAIAGEELCRICSPVKVTFNQNERRNGILFISVISPAFSLEVQSSQQRLLNKIHTYFGYEAISKIRIVIRNKKVKVATNDNVTHKPKLKVESEKNFNKALEKTTGNEDLKTALERLRKAMFN